ncbi:MULTISPECIES: site-specific integrase [Niastella]|uniref:Tyrosine-type recombinase/integrase n=1 Tax=Niastella soli TaxID=2821487 RepID=A0ABS3YUH5_9BACT|nr:site-specific integrase [Niastella soli]MBO9201589.1 tyrosine-type recombinase/integrase [Niastella soli]
MGQKLKSSKGEISISNFQGRIRLRWRHAGERYSLNLPHAYLPENLHHGTVKATEIKLDVIRGCFDPSLEKYKPEIIVKPKAFKQVEVPVTTAKTQSPTLLHELVTNFNDWCANIRNVDIENSIDYLYTRRLLEKWVNIPIDQVAQKLNGENWAVTTYNRRLGYLNTFFAWLVSRKVIELNPLQDVCRKREKKRKKNPRRIPLEETEILTFLEAIKNNTYCQPSSAVKHSYYYPCLSFIFYTGVRNAEAIGLRVRHVDFDSKTVEISEAFARTIKGTNHAARIQKGTKMENVRYLPLTDELFSLLEYQLNDKTSDEFVFPSPTGLCIDDKMLQRRVIKPVLKELGFDDRDLYAARRSFGTRAIQQGMPLTDVAYLMGHSTIETASRNYVHVGKPAIALPAININKKSKSN